MKQIFSTVVIPIVIGLIVAYFAFNLNKQFVDLRYTISEKIPTKYIESSTAETVQQLVVKNNGNIPAEKINIKIVGEIIESDILKNSISDKVEEHYSNGHFEAMYPYLPPDAQFSYIFKTSGIGLTKRLVEITHNKGKGTEAFSGDAVSTVNKASTLLSIGAMVFYLFLLAIQGRSIAIDHLESSGSYTGFYEYLSKSKPFYVSQDKWNSIRRKYIEKMSKVEFYRSNDIEDIESYKILNQDKPTYLSTDEWELLKKMCTKCLVDYFSYYIKKSSHYGELSKYFTIKQPINFPDNQWAEITQEINKNFIVSKKLNEKFYLNAEDIVKELNAGMPNGMLGLYWDQYREYLLKRYYEIIYRDLLNKINPMNYLETVDLSIFNKEKQERLNELAYKIQLTNFKNISSLYEANEFLEKGKPDWLAVEDFKKMEEIAKKYIEIDKSSEKYRYLFIAINNIVNLIPLGKKESDVIEDNEWEQFKDLEGKILSKAIKIEKDKEKLETEKQETHELKNKILNQLKIVNETLNDPKSLDRVEQYDNPFSKGNFENLQIVSRLLKKQ